jgi:hypothetical protein
VGWKEERAGQLEANMREDTLVVIIEDTLLKARVCSLKVSLI